MSKPWIHAQSSAKRYGGKPEDYLDIHDLMDSSKGAFPDNRHRALTHNSWFISTIIEKVFGHVRTNSDGKSYSTRQIAEEHILEDFRQKFIPTAADYLQEMEIKDWMNNAANNQVPSSNKKIDAKVSKIVKTTFKEFTVD